MKLTAGYPIERLLKEYRREDCIAIEGGLFTGRILPAELKGVRSECGGLTMIRRHTKQSVSEKMKSVFDRRSYFPCFVSSLCRPFPDQPTNAVGGFVRPCVSCGFCREVCPAGIVPYHLYRLLESGPQRRPPGPSHRFVHWVRPVFVCVPLQDRTECPVQTDAATGYAIRIPWRGGRMKIVSTLVEKFGPLFDDGRPLSRVRPPLESVGQMVESSDSVTVHTSLLPGSDPCPADDGDQPDCAVAVRGRGDLFFRVTGPGVDRRVLCDGLHHRGRLCDPFEATDQ